MAEQADATAAGNRIEPEAAVLVYRREDGAIVSTHYFGTAPGGALPDVKELHAAALANAIDEGLGEDDALAPLAVDPARLARGVAYRVRPETGELEALPPPERGATAD